MTATETLIVTKRLRDRPNDSWTLPAVQETGGYDALRKALTMDPAAIAEEVKASGLRGRGGAGFPTATKWSFLPVGVEPRYLVVNCDEAEPSTFKDRMLVERDPHQLIEGMAIASFALNVHHAFVYVRGEFALGAERLAAAVAEARAEGLIGPDMCGSGFDFEITVHRGAGAYICGEETALLNSLEGDRGMPRIRPPFPAIAGLYAKPTVVNNVETISTLPGIISMGGEAYGAMGVERSRGTRIFSLSGNVNKPGNYELELGLTFRQLIDDFGGGLAGPGPVKFFIPGGASSQWLTDEHLDVPLDMDLVTQQYGVMLGSGAVMVYNQDACPVRVALRLAKFFAHESCGKCTPCREGTGWIQKVLYRIEHGEGRDTDLDLLLDVGDNISPGLNAPFSQTTICPLGPSAVSAIVSLNKFFRDDVMMHVKEGKCRLNPRGRVTVTIDGVELQAEAGELVIKVAQDHGVYIPRFCWHERMKPVGMCRMCLVEIEGQRGLPPACTATVTDGMVVHTQTPGVKKAQEGVLEFLLINHPLDCPVCDRGGECPLQDLTFGYGPGESRFVEEKRHFAKPIAISELVLLDRERCILCARCTRFADEVAGDPLIQFVERGAEMQVLTFPDQPFTSYFSGNTVQICPVGALLASPYRFRARPWDLSSVETSCQLCSLNCRIALQSSADRLVRALGVDSEPLNHGWLCDKGRFAFNYVHDADRIVDPQVRGIDGTRSAAAWPEALDAAAAGVAGALERSGPSSVAVIGGARGTNEDAYAWARFAKGVVKTDNVDCQVGDGLPAEVVTGLPRARLSDCDTARAIVLLAPDLKEELAVAYLRVKRAVVDLKVPLIEISAVETGLTRYADVVLRHLPGEAASRAERLAALVAQVPTPAQPAASPAESSGEPAAESSSAASAEPPAPSAPAEPPEAPEAESEAAPAAPAAISPATDPAEPGAASSPSGEADAELRAAAERLRGDPGDERPVIVILGRPSLAEPADATVAAAAALRDIPGVRFLSALRRSNVHGGIDLGLAPGFLPGRVTLDAGRAWFEAAWGGVPAERGLDTAGILRAAADGRLQALVLLGADPLSDFPDRTLARQAMEKVPFIVAVDAFPTPSTDAAHVFLPAALAGEKRGTTTNLEGRLLRLARKVTPPGTAMEDWRVAVELALRLGVDFDLEAVDEVTDEIARLAPAHQGADAALLRQAVDGAVIPLGELEEPVLGGPAHAISPAADSDPGIIGGPIESLVVTAGSSSAYGTAPPSGTVAALPSRSGAHPGEGLSPPPVHRWERSAVPAPDGASGDGAGGPGLRLWAGRKLYSPGVAVTHSEAVATLAAPAVIRLHPEELSRLGMASGAPARVTSARGAVTLPASADKGIPPGLVWMPAAAAADLIDVATATFVTVEVGAGG